VPVLRTSDFVLLFIGGPRPHGRGYFLPALRASLYFDPLGLEII